MPIIPLNNIAPWTQAIAYAGQTVFSTNWTADALTDVVVYSRPSGIEADDATQIVSTMDYNVAFIGSNQYVQVTFIAGKERAAGDIVTVMRNTPADRMNLYINTNFTPTMLNEDFNREVMMIQQRVLCDNSLSVKYNNSETLNPNGITDNILPYLPPGYCWVKNTPNTRIIAALNGTGGGGGTNMIVVISQPNHGFIADQVVYFNGIKYALAQADTSSDAEVIGMVASVIDVNNFTLLVGGQVLTNTTTFVPGGVYFLSDVTPGLLTLTEPTTTGHISKPLLIASGTNEGYFYNFRGKIINAPTFPWNEVTTDTQLVANENYYTTGGGVLNLTLPVSCSAGSIIQIQGYNSTGWKIVQNAGQSIQVESTVTTVGVAGFLSSTNKGDGLTLLCVVANTTFMVVGAPIGNITYN